jgi:hypothetical protein
MVVRSLRTTGSVTPPTAWWLRLLQTCAPLPAVSSPQMCLFVFHGSAVCGACAVGCTPAAREGQHCCSLPCVPIAKTKAFHLCVCVCTYVCVCVCLCVSHSILHGALNIKHVPARHHFVTIVTLITVTVSNLMACLLALIKRCTGCLFQKSNLPLRPSHCTNQVGSVTS